MVELVEFLVRALVAEPDRVRVDVVSADTDLVIEVRVADSDLGRVIGRDGRVANAIRTVVKAAASARRGKDLPEGSRVMVEIVED
ncbi:KH domain-containing protein [Thermoleophilia bacterium SCSIO 60948]|nr:KH domain-containing protein [Thermoleophilia bacterium SCSIO 60948]